MPERGAGRFAPTPTGRLHMGNMRTALMAWLSTRNQGLRNILRVEDLDPGAIPNGCLEGQYRDLEWLGLIYDESPIIGGPVGPYRQSERYDQFNIALDSLNQLGLLYPCWCSRKEVREAAIAPHASDEGPVYTGICRPRKPTVLPSLDSLPQRAGRQPALRINVGEAMARVGRQRITFVDGIAGEQSFNIIEHMGDFVVRRVDRIAAYQVACAWDDVAMGCTEVLRGRDLLPSTARQLLILELLQLPFPAYAHAGLVTNALGLRLAKRDGATSIEDMRNRGLKPHSVIRTLAKLSNLPDTADLDLLTDAFANCRLSRHDVQIDGH
jgi:glutamyl-tRNA synthetase